MATMKIFGGNNVPLIRNISPQRGTWRVHWGKTTNETEGTYYFGYDFDHKPSLDEVKKVIANWYNEQTQAKITSEFSWNGNAVWLSTENQLNYTMAYNMAVKQGENFSPITLKFGSEGNPMYHTFSTSKELMEFYFKVTEFIQETLKKGWEMKDSIDYDAYRTILESM